MFADAFYCHTVTCFSRTFFFFAAAAAAGGRKSQLVDF